MKIPFRSAFAATLLSIASLHAASSDGSASHWLPAFERCAARAPQSECEKGFALVQAAMRTAAAPASGNRPGGGGDALSRAAAAVAAYVVLERLYPEQQEDLEVKLAVVLADVPESQAKADALAHGRRVATELLTR